MQYLAEWISTKMYFLCAQHKIFGEGKCSRDFLLLLYSCFRFWFFAVAKLVGTIKLLNSTEYLMIIEDPNRIWNLLAKLHTKKIFAWIIEEHFARRSNNILLAGWESITVSSAHSTHIQLTTSNKIRDLLCTFYSFLRFYSLLRAFLSLPWIFSVILKYFPKKPNIFMNISEIFYGMLA